MLKWIFAGLILILNFSSSFASSKIVKKIEYEGLVNVTLAQIKPFISQEENKPLDLYKLNNSLKELYSTGYFDQILIYFSDFGTLSIIFQEAPIIEEIEWSGIKTKRVKKLLEKKEEILKKGIFLRKAFLEGYKLDILSYLKEEAGLYWATITTQTLPLEKSGKNKVKLIINLDEGEEVKIKRINFLGKLSFSQFRLRWLMKACPGGFFSRAILRADVKKLIDFYRKKGFPLVHIPPPSIYYSKELEGLVIDFQIEEGTRFKIRHVLCYSDQYFSSEELLSHIGGEKILYNKWYNPEIIDSVRRKLLGYVTKKGYIEAKIEHFADFNWDKKRMDILFCLEVGERNYIDKIIVEGNKKTKDYVIKRELLLKEGDVIDAEKIHLSLQRLFNLGYFKNVEVKILPASQHYRKILKIIVEEDKNILFTFGGSYSSQIGTFFTLSGTLENLFGRGYSSIIKAEVGKKVQNYEFSFHNPYLFNKPVSCELEVWKTEQKLKDHTRRQRGGAISLAPAISPFNRLYLRYSAQDIAIVSPKEEAAEEVKEWIKRWGEAKYVATNLIKFRFTRDRRDFLIQPTKGYLISLSQELCGGKLLGGNIDYLNSTFDISYYFPLLKGKKLVFCHHIFGGEVHSIQGDEYIPPTVRFYLGGANSLRGYPEQAFPDKSGGLKSLFSNLELRFYITNELSLALFYDIGDAWSENKEVSFKDLKEGWGWGLRILAGPLGVLRFDYGYALSQPYLGSSKFHFAFGYPF